MTHRDKRGRLHPSSKSQRLVTETTLVSPSSSRDDKSDDMRRYLTVIRTSVNQRQASSLTCRDQHGHLHPLSKTQRLSTETTLVSPSSSRDDKSNDRWRHLTVVRTSVNQRQASLLTHRDQRGRLHPLSKTQRLSTKTTLVSLPSSRDKQVR